MLEYGEKNKLHEKKKKRKRKLNWLPTFYSLSSVSLTTRLSSKYIVPVFELFGFLESRNQKLYFYVRVTRKQSTSLVTNSSHYKYPWLSYFSPISIWQFSHRNCRTLFIARETYWKTWNSTFSSGWEPIFLTWASGHRPYKPLLGE